MFGVFEDRVEALQRRLADDRVDVAVLTEPGTVYYLSGFHSYLFMEFARPTILVVPRSGECTIITPTLESEMCASMTWIDDIRPWLDGVGGEWTTPLRDILAACGRFVAGIEREKVPPVVLDFLAREFPSATLRDVGDAIADMRMVKGPEEIAVARQAGKVAVEMVEGAAAALGEGVPEYEVALAVYAAGTRKAAELMADGEPDPLMSPTVHNLQILQSGPETSMCHRRSTLRRIARGDPVFLCFCGITSFRQFKIGFDRELFIGEVRDEYVPLYDVALRSQAAALGARRPGVTAEEVHGAYAEVIREAGFEFSYRTGRGVGYSYLERPQLKFGDKTVLRPGMVLAVDGGCTVPGVFRGQVGDTVLVTETGYEFLTDYPRALESLVVA